MPRRSIRSATAATIVVVLPVPGPASTSSGPPCVVHHPLLRLVQARRARAIGTGRRTQAVRGRVGSSITIVDSSTPPPTFEGVPLA